MKKLLQSNIETLSKISVVGLVLINICVDMGHIGHFISTLDRPGILPASQQNNSDQLDGAKDDKAQADMK